MTSKLLSSGSYGCVYHPGITCDKKTITKKYATKIQLSNESSDNELQISKIIKKIPMHNKYFVPVFSSCPIHLTELDKGIVKQCDVLKNKKKNNLVLMEMDFINGITLDSYLINTKNAQLLINSFISSYTYLLHSLKLLRDNNIVHFDLKGNNIMFDKNKNIPLIIDFGLSIDLEKVNDETYDFYFFTYAPSYYVWCPEIHFINYIVNNDKFTHNDIKKICDEIIKGNYILHNILTRDELRIYKDEMESYYLKFKNMSKNDIIKKLLDTSHTWDNYSLSTIYLKIVSKFFNNKEYKDNDFIIKYIKLLQDAMHPNPDKRISIEICLDMFEDILSSTHKKSFKHVLYSLVKNRKTFNKETFEISKKEKKMGEIISTKR